MNNWIFTVTSQKSGNYTLTANEIFRQRMQDEFWGLGERTPNRRNIQQGDRIVFYVGYPERVFAGIARTATTSFELSDAEAERFTHDNPVLNSQYGTRLSKIEVWENPKFVPELVDQLSFIENKEYWGAYFQGGVRGITDEDYETILKNGHLIDQVRVGRADREEPESASQFALEAHLEEFMHANWGQISWDRSLRLYDLADSAGRQFPAGTWSIDFLAVDNNTGDFVVIELKRGQTSDQTVGQVLRYMGWVSANLAEEGQIVKGIIVCRETDEALRYAIANLPNIAVFTYRVNFSLQSMSKER